MVEGLRRTLSHLFARPYDHVIEEIRKLGELDRGWNTYGAGRISPEAIDQAARFAGRLAERPGIPAPSVVPTPNGGVSLHWLTRDRDVELIFLARGGEYSVAERGKEDIIEAGSFGDVVDVLKDVVVAHVR